MVVFVCLQHIIIVNALCLQKHCRDIAKKACIIHYNNHHYRVYVARKEMGVYASFKVLKTKHLVEDQIITVHQLVIK